MRETVTEKEKAVLDAMRMGADVQVRFAGLETYQEFDEAFACFDNLEAVRPMNIYDMTGTFFSFVSFDREYQKLMVLASINMKGGEKNE